MKPLLLFCGFCITGAAFCQPAPPARALNFRKVQVAAESFESVAVFDVDGDSVLDLVSGSFWYKGPQYRVRHFMYDVKRYGEYYDDFSTLPIDVNEDGKMDFITGGWWGNTIRWVQNPGRDTIWTEHTIAQTGNVETTRLWDVDGDGVPEAVPNTPGGALAFYKKEKGTPTFTKHQVAEKHGHGLGFGDINGDGRGDFVTASGWLEAPKDAQKGQWVLHAEFDLGLASVPILVTDINKDGRPDLIAGQAHDYGLYWYEQKEEKKTRKWVRHPIDPFHSQFHALLWADLDNDGQEELVTGKRFRAHNEKDPGSFDPVGLYYYKWNGESFTKHVISFGPAGDGKGTGICFSVADLDGNNWKDVVVAGKDGLFIFYNLGFEP
jgi:hypothetical protein